MAINIGTNFSYKGQQFLDQRQKVATKRDLLSWSIAVPEGFEVYCEEDSKWYIYDSKNSSPLTGRYKIRLEKELEGSEIQATLDSNTEDITNLNKVVFPLHFENVIGTGDYEYKSSGVLPSISWDLVKNGKKVIADLIIVDGVLSPRVDKYIPDRPIHETTTYRIDAIYNGENGERCHMDAQVRLRLYGYVFVKETRGLVTKSWLLSQQPTDGLFIKEFTPEDNEDKTYSLNCGGNEVNGGKYVHLVFPTDFVEKIIGSGKIGVYVGGMLFSDIREIGIISIEGRVYHNLIFTFPQNSENLNITLKHQ